ncbi:CHAD domain-containing protein [Trinickia dinghuensis]|uniref:CHAD domain-containing protein n=1 Tax=Trinickia dinghuensis TaxID=2291023 RepID=A0A3D8JPQ8_9BURK|nr:CHAD domain-containing protein [Trinickia dinghuensis]RDU95089.1 CHAD domain-containing protein [Trinickia dinghuensis]
MGTVELVLAVEPTAASEWMAGPAPARSKGCADGHAAADETKHAVATRKQYGSGRSGVSPSLVHTDAGTAIADALSRMPGIAPIRAVELSTVRAFVSPDGVWRVMFVADEEGARRVTAVRANEFAPGVRRCETVCDEPLEAGTSFAIGDAFPQAVKHALGKQLGTLAPSRALTVCRGVWRWSGPGGAVVDIELHDARVAGSADAAAAKSSSPSEHGAMSIAFCELRLASRIGETQGLTDVEAGSSPAAAAAAEQAQRADESAAESDACADAECAALRALFAAAGALADTLPVFPLLTDGYGRACLAGGADPAPVRAAHVDLRGVKTPHGALMAVSANVARQWFGNEAGVRDDTGTDTEFVHQMRVALRRLKTLLKTFRRWADDAWERTIAPDLDWLGGLLGQARDLDVFVDSTLPVLAEADVDTAAWAPLRERAAARRDEARSQVRAALRTRRYAALSLAWLRWLAAQHFSQGPSVMRDKSLADYAAKRVRKHYRRLIEKPGLTALTPAQRHRRRIEAKRLRYTLEFFQPLASRKTQREIAKQLSRIQSVLGDGSDATAALHFLEALDVLPYKHGFARGWCEAVNRWSAIEGDRLLQDLGKPKIVRGA